MTDPRNPYFKGFNTPITAAEESWERQNANLGAPFGAASSGGSPVYAGGALRPGAGRTASLIVLAIVVLVLVGIGVNSALTSARKSLAAQSTARANEVVAAFKAQREPGLLERMRVALPITLTPDETRSLEAAIVAKDQHARTEYRIALDRSTSMQVNFAAFSEPLVPSQIQSVKSGSYSISILLPDAYKAFGEAALMNAAQRNCAIATLSRQGIVSSDLGSVETKSYVTIETINVICRGPKGLYVQTAKDRR